MKPSAHERVGDLKSFMSSTSSSGEVSAYDGVDSVNQLHHGGEGKRRWNPDGFAEGLSSAIRSVVRHQSPNSARYNASPRDL